MKKTITGLVLGVLLISGWMLSTANKTTVGEPVDMADATETEEYTIDPADFVDVSIVSAAPAPVSTELSIDEQAGLLLMREEEKLARDVYQALGDMWDVQIFTNIAASEQTHTDAVLALLNVYALPDPVGTDTPGLFQNPQLQQLYNQLVAQGSTSLEAALVVGATVEDLDIYDLDRLMAQTQNEQILAVYRNLQKGSRNHLRAFTRQLDRRGVGYQAQYISEELFMSIVNTAQERGQL